MHVPYYLESSCAQLPKTLRTNVWSSDWSFKWTRGFIPIAYRWNTGSSSNSEMWRHVGNVHRLEKISANWFFVGENSGSLNWLLISIDDFYRMKGIPIKRTRIYFIRNLLAGLYTWFIYSTRSITLLLILAGTHLKFLFRTFVTPQIMTIICINLINQLRGFMSRVNSSLNSY